MHTLYQVIPTKWRTYRDHIDAVTSFHHIYTRIRIGCPSSSSSSDNGADSIPSNIAPRVNKQMDVYRESRAANNEQKLGIRTAQCRSTI